MTCPRGGAHFTGHEPEAIVVTAATLDPTQRLFHDQLPAEEREAYLRELRKHSPAPGGRRTVSGYLSDIAERARFLLDMLASLVWCPSRRSSSRLILVSSYGPTLARFDAALEAPQRTRR